MMDRDLGAAGNRERIETAEIAAAGGSCAPIAAADVAPRPVSANFAALDLGTNNCRLLVARPAPMGSGGFRVVDAFSRIVRLGEGLAATGVLSEAAMARTLEALKICAGKIAQRRVAVGALRRHRSLPPSRELRRVPRRGCARKSASTSRSSRPPRRRASSSPAARRCSTRACPMRWSSISAAARPRSSGCAARPRRISQRRGGAPEILGSISLPFGVVTLTERFGGIEVTAAIYRAMVAEARRRWRRSRSATASAAISRRGGCRCSAARAR